MSIEVDGELKLTLSDHALLDKATEAGRVRCFKCAGSRMYYCGDCVVSLLAPADEEQPSIESEPEITAENMEEITSETKHNKEDRKKEERALKRIKIEDQNQTDLWHYGWPVVTLPIPILVIKHIKESSLKATTLPLIFSSPQASIYHFDPKVEYDKNQQQTSTLASMILEGAAILFPTPDSPTVADMGKEKASKISQIIVIESQWQLTKQIMRHPALQNLPCLQLKDYKTTYWRYQSLGDEGLATIEAVYYFYRELSSVLNSDPTYSGQYDNLLWFYIYLYNKIQKTCKNLGREVKFKEGWVKGELKSPEQPQ